MFQGLQGSHFAKWENLYVLTRWGQRIHTSPLLLCISVHCHNLCKNGEGKTNGLKQALPSVTSYLSCYSSGLAHFLYTARVDSEFPYMHTRFRMPQTCCTHVWSVGLQLGPWWYMYLCVWMHTMTSVCSALFKTRILVIKYPKGVLTEGNRFPLSRFFLIVWADGIRSWNWPGGNLCLCLPYWAGSVMLAPAESLGSWAEAVLRYPSALCTIWLHPWIYASANQHPTLYLYFFLTSLSHNSI